MMRLFRKLVALCAPKNPQLRELYYLKRAYRKGEYELDRIYAILRRDGGSQYPGLSYLEDKQERRQKLIARLEQKGNA